MGMTFKEFITFGKRTFSYLLKKTSFTKALQVQYNDLSDPALANAIGEKAPATLNEELELVEGVYPVFDQTAYLNSELQPVFFGSALNNFGVQELLNCFIDIAPAPCNEQQ